MFKSGVFNDCGFSISPEIGEGIAQEHADNNLFQYVRKINMENNMDDYQAPLKALLDNKFNTLEIECEWRSKIDNEIYSPRLDIAVGPFSIENDVQLIDQYKELQDSHSEFIGQLVESHLNNVFPGISPDLLTDYKNQKLGELKYFNENARCFIAIEIENMVTQKHLMGGAINASALGNIGLASGYNDDTHKNFLRLFRYFNFLEKVGKPPFKTNNLLIVSYAQLSDLLK